MENDGMLRDVTFQKWFTGFEPINGVMMPTGFKTVIDFRNVVQSQMYVTRNSVDGPIDDLAAPQAVRSAVTPTPQTPVGGPAAWLFVPGLALVAMAACAATRVSA